MHRLIVMSLAPATARSGEGRRGRDARPHTTERGSRSRGNPTGRRRGANEGESLRKGTRGDVCDAGRGRREHPVALGRAKGSISVMKCGLQRGRGGRTRERTVCESAQATALQANIATRQRPDWAGRQRVLDKRENSCGTRSELGSERSRDASLERLGHYLTARLNVESDSDEEVDGFLLEDGSDLECLSDISAMKPASVAPCLSADLSCQVKKAEKDGGSGGLQAECDDSIFLNAKCFSPGQFDNVGSPSENGAVQSCNALSTNKALKVAPESDDDGWNSDSNDLTLHFPSRPGDIEYAHRALYLVYLQLYCQFSRLGIQCPVSCAFIFCMSTLVFHMLLVFVSLSAISVLQCSLFLNIPYRLVCF